MLRTVFQPMRLELQKLDTVASSPKIRPTPHTARAAAGFQDSSKLTVLNLPSSSPYCCAEHHEVLFGYICR
ncbi:hypothetical protein I7I50_08457 [Histoplasma capsulatum G186AR]|uniref:Uncharacterized protein n=1 Tax=Ajellomyces capsulatus TaxID=5037 RepID=A0A8H7YTX0_AJECA|nr:hypothetical protein I7I52_05972 [Histoplasma capsulatum]QSS73616.1 hypothetical protein I7I50_08457 [Histoplasma capsulatum G186AR]